MKIRILTCCAGALFAASALAQSGTLDQLSPYDPGQGANAIFNADATSLIWQVQIRPALTGQLEGLRIAIQGNPGAQFSLRIRAGAAPSGQPIAFQTNVAKTTADPYQILFIDMTSANFNITAGSPFVMEIQGLGQGTWIYGSYVDPGTGNPPLYPEPLYLNGSEFVPGWKIGFGSYVTSGSNCPADWNGDGQVDFFDYLDFVQDFNDDNADFNGDGQTDFFDYLDFVQAFDEGCD